MKRAITLVVAAGALLVATMPTAQADPAVLRVAFSSNRAGPSHIFKIRTNGSNERQLTSGALDDIQPAWSPDGAKIAFSRGALDGASNFVSRIWVMRADGSNAHPITPLDQTTNYRPAWSPDGTKIAFSRGDGINGAVWIMNSDGSEARPVTNGAALDNFPAWSPSGTALAFYSTRDGAGDLYTIPVNGHDPADVRRLTTDSTARAPSWAPGVNIVFSRVTATGNEIWKIRADGGFLRRVLTLAGENRFPTWGPNREVAFVHSEQPGCLTTACDYQIWLARPGEAPVQVTHTVGSGLTAGESSPSLA